MAYESTTSIPIPAGLSATSSGRSVPSSGMTETRKTSKRLADLDDWSKLHVRLHFKQPRPGVNVAEVDNLWQGFVGDSEDH